MDLVLNKLRIIPTHIPSTPQICSSKNHYWDNDVNVQCFLLCLVFYCLFIFCLMVSAYTSDIYCIWCEVVELMNWHNVVQQDSKTSKPPIVQTWHGYINIGFLFLPLYSLVRKGSHHQEWGGGGGRPATRGTREW